LLSIIINVKNGERYLDRCLNSLSKFDDVVILDNFSTDDTLDIASKYTNVRVFQHDFCGMGQLRNMAASYAKNDWIFVVDSDEVLSPQLVDKLLAMNFKDSHVYLVKRHNYLANQLINSSAWENDWVARIYNRKITKYSLHEVHESVITDGLHKTKIDQGFIYHFTYEKVEELIDKMQLYSSWYAKQNYSKKRLSLFSIWLRSVFTFFKCYIIKRGFLDGFEGLVISTYNALGVFSKHVKIYEICYNKQLGLALSLSNINDLADIINNINQQQLLPEHVFLIVDDSILEINSQEIAKLLNGRLIIPFAIIGKTNQDENVIINSFLINYPGLNHIIYLKDNKMLKDLKLLKKCKKIVLNNGQIYKVQIINNFLKKDCSYET